MEPQQAKVNPKSDPLETQIRFRCRRFFTKHSSSTEKISSKDGGTSKKKKNSILAGDTSHYEHSNEYFDVRGVLLIQNIAPHPQFSY